MMDVVVPGGVMINLDDAAIATLREDHARLREQARSLFDILDDQPSLEDRLLSTGYLSPETARALGASGYVGKASGQAIDLRTDGLYAPYTRLRFNIALSESGDVATRMGIRQEEVFSSLNLMDEMLKMLEQQTDRTDIYIELPSRPGGEGLGLIDGWRGEIVSYVRLDDEGRVARFFARDPSWFTWPALERIVLGNIVPDFPVCNKSVNGSYSGHDL